MFILEKVQFFLNRISFLFARERKVVGLHDMYMDKSGRSTGIRIRKKMSPEIDSVPEHVDKFYQGPSELVSPPCAKNVFPDST